jgi:hypothetical protein
VRLGASRGMPANLVPRTVGSVPTRGLLGTAWEVVLAGAAYRVFRFTLQGLNQSIVGLSPLSETA